MLSEYQKMPGLARLINQTSDFFHKQTQPLVHLDENELLKSACQRVSLDDYGPPHFREGLHRLIASLKNEVDLTFLGQVLQRRAIERGLENRLQFIDLKKKRPDIFERKLNPPIIIMGLPRSGTTFLHRLIAADPVNRGLYFWELIRPVVPEHQPDMRRQTATMEYRTFRQLTVHFDHIHVIRPTEYEECIFLMVPTFQTGTFWVLAPVYSYIEWCFSAERYHLYNEYHELLKIFQAQTPGRRLTLKAPAHTGALTEIVRLIPDAIIIQTHRHPVDVVNSLNSLIYYAHTNVARRIDVARMGRFHLKMLADDINRSMFARKYHGIDVHDVIYEDLLADPIGVIKRIYADAGIELSRQAEENMRTYIAANPQNKHGRHTYRADDFGMTDKEINEQFTEYMDRFGYDPR